MRLKHLQENSGCPKIKRNRINQRRIIETTKIFSLVFMLIFISGCVSEATHILSGPKFPPTKPETIQILLEKPNNEYIVIGLVESRGMGLSSEAKDLELSMKALKNEASSLGADAIIVQASSQEIADVSQYGVSTERRIKGIAIKYK